MFFVVESLPDCFSDLPFMHCLLLLLLLFPYLDSLFRPEEEEEERMGQTAFGIISHWDERAFCWDSLIKVGIGE